jgi:hypothetical protein
MIPTILRQVELDGGGIVAGQDIQNDSLRRCFLFAPRGAAADSMARLLAERGIECLRPEDLLAPGAVWSDELTRHLATADFVVAIVPPSAPAQVAFELGLAHGLSKPALVIATGKTNVPEELRGLATVRISGLGHVLEATPDIDRFLRHAKRVTSDEPATSRRQEFGELTWARERLASLRGKADDGRVFGFERLVAELLERAGAEVQLTGADRPTDDGEDLILWSDDLAYEMGGPILVQCKIYHGGIGSVVKDAEHAMRQLDEVVRRSDVRLGVLVFDHDRSTKLPRLNDTPRVLVFPVEQLLDTIERGALTEEVLARRRQAAYARGRSGADHIQ